MTALLVDHYLWFQQISARSQPLSSTSLSLSLTGRKLSPFPSFFCKLPAFQMKPVFLFVHHPYPFLDVNPTGKTNEQSHSEDDLESSEESESEDIQEIRDDSESALPKYNDRNTALEALEVENLFAGDQTSDF